MSETAPPTANPTGAEPVGAEPSTAEPAGPEPSTAEPSTDEPTSARPGGVASTGASTRDRILAAALSAYGTEGYAATSLDALADQLGIRKQTILYWFPSKPALFDAVIDAAATDLVALFDTEASRGLTGIAQVEAIVRRVFRLAVGRPELLGLVREVTRPGSPAAGRLGGHVAPSFDRARDFLAREMDAGRLRRSDPSMLLLSLYSTVVGVATELEVQRAMGLSPSLRATVGRRQELIRFLRAALDPGAPSDPAGSPGSQGLANPPSIPGSPSREPAPGPGGQ